MYELRGHLFFSGGGKDYKRHEELTSDAFLRFWRRTGVISPVSNTPVAVSGR